MSRIRLYLDEDVMDHGLVEGLLRRHEDVTTTFERGMTDADDEPQLDFATSLGRVIYTGNAGDFCRLHHEFLTIGRAHAGIIVVGPRLRRNIGEQLRRLVHLMNSRSAEEMENSLEFLSNWIW